MTTTISLHLLSVVYVVVDYRRHHQAPPHHEDTTIHKGAIPNRRCQCQNQCQFRPHAQFQMGQIRVSVHTGALVRTAQSAFLLILTGIGVWAGVNVLVVLVVNYQGHSVVDPVALIANINNA
jgi:hypothetical protein